MGYSRLVIVVLLVTTVALGSGASMVEQSSSLDAFQSGTSRAANAQEYISNNFTQGSSNTTTVQIIVRDDNVLSKQSLIQQLKVQQALRNNKTVNETLANDSQTIGVANILAVAAVRMDRAEDLKARGEKLKKKGEALKKRAEKLKRRSNELNESKEELKARGERLKQRGKKLKQRGKILKQRAQQLNQSRQELKRRAAMLKERAEALNESRQQLQRKGAALKERAEALNESRRQLERKGATLKERAEALNESRQQLQRKGVALKERAEALNESRQQLQRKGAALKERAEALNESREKLEQRKQDLEQRAQALKQDRKALKQDTAALKERAETLNESRAELKQRKQDLEQRAQRINETRASLTERREELERRAKELAEDRRSGTVPPEELERRARKLKQDTRDLANDTAALKERADELKEDRDALKRDGAALRERAQELNESRTELKQRKQELKQRARTLEQDTKALKQDAAALKQRAQALNESRTELQQRKQELKRKGAQLKQDKEAVEQRAKELKRKGTQLKQDKEAVEQRAKELKRKGAQLKQDKEAVEQRAKELKRKGAQLKQDKEAVEQRAKELKRKGAQLKQDKEALEQMAKKLEAKRSVLENDSAALKERAQALQNDAAALKSDQKKLEQRAEELESDRDALLNGGPNLSLSERIDVLESRNRSEIETVVSVVLGESGTNSTGTSDRTGVFAFMPTNYEPGTTTANATMILLTQTSESTTSAGTASDRPIESQLAVQEITQDQYADNAYVFGAGIITDEIQRSMTDSLIIVGPLALLFVLVVLILAYRDLIDILLGLFGIALVLVWTFGFMGWVGISFSQIFIAVPVLLIGLSIDYAIHVFMRHRETREQTTGVRGSMRSTLGGIGSALILVTLTAVIGFLSNLASSVPPIREFGIVCSVGICAALIIFGALIPALKVELDIILEARGFDRTKRAFGTGGGTLGSLLAGGAVAARRAPRAVLVIALLLTVAGGIGASQVDTSFSQEDFLADDPPAWMNSLPEPLAPSEYTAKSSLDFVNEHFLRQDSNAAILTRGNVTDPEALMAIARAERNASNQSTTVVLSSGESDIKSPLSVMESVAAKNESFNKTFVKSDTNGDGIPDSNLERVYDALYEADPQAASSVIYRTDGTYEALRMTVSIEGSASGSEVTEQMRTVASSVESSESSDLRAIATGQPIVFKIVQDRLLQTVIESLLITLVVTFVFLMIVYRFLHGSAMLGFVTLLPVGFSVAWILGTMYLLNIPFNIITGLITSLTVGLGIAYSIHLSERYSLELRDGTGTAWQALRTAVIGTGGALLGSAATTVGGFGVLGFAILPPLRQFGIITGLTIIYAFLASVFVLPSLLVVWTRWFGPDDSFRSQWTFGPDEETPSTPTSSNDD